MMTQEKAYLTLEEAAERLNKSVSSIRGYIARGILRKFRRPLDHRVYVSASAVEAIKTAEPQPVDEAENGN